MTEPNLKLKLGENYHGSAGDALEYALDHCRDYVEMDDFLRAWREGDLADFEPYYEWLRLRQFARGDFKPRESA